MTGTAAIPRRQIAMAAWSEQSSGRTAALDAPRSRLHRALSWPARRGPPDLPPNQLRQTPLPKLSVAGWLSSFSCWSAAWCSFSPAGARGPTLPNAHLNARLPCTKPQLCCSTAQSSCSPAAGWASILSARASLCTLTVRSSAQRASSLRRRLYLWSAYNFILLAVVPYVVFRVRGYSREQLNLKSANWKNDTLVILVVLAVGCLMDFRGPSILQLTLQQRIAGGLLSFVIHLLLTDFPVMIFIYAILLPRYARLFLRRLPSCSEQPVILQSTFSKPLPVMTRPLTR